MKKFFVMALALLATVSVNAEEFGPEKGSIGVELQFNPFANGFNTFRMDGLKARYFVTEQHAVRLNLGLNNFNTTKNYTFNDNDTYYTKDKTGSFKLDLGYEYHFLQKGRINMYAGAQFGYGKNFASGKNVANTGFDATTGDPTGKVETEYTNVTATPGVGAASTLVTFDLFTGIDFYLYKGLYIGAELGLGISSQTACDQEVKATGAAAVKTISPDKNNNWGFAAEPALRLGWTF